MTNQDYYYSAKYLNLKFDCNLKTDLSKEKICDEIENKTGRETNIIDILNVSEDYIAVEYCYYELSNSKIDSIFLNLSDL